MTAIRVTFVIPTLTSGGAERVLTTMANYWAAHDRDVTVLTMTAQDEEPFYALTPAVHRVGLRITQTAKTPAHAVTNNIRRLKRLRRAIQASRPDVVISFLDQMNVLTLIATRGIGLPVVVCEHTDPGLAKRHPVWDRMRTVLYPRATRVVVLSESSRCFFGPRIRSRTVVIPNPVAVAPASAPVEKSARPQIVSMGRFGPEKGFDRLLDAFAQVADAFPDWDLVIWGDGDLRPALISQIEQLQLGERVRLPGKTTRPHTELRTAEIYALTSHREGFPMALAEAMACGLPAVAFDLPSGPRDIIRDGVDGILVPNGDVPAFAHALGSMMGAPECRSAMADRAPEVLARFGVDQVMTVWNDMLDELTNTR